MQLLSQRQIETPNYVERVHLNLQSEQSPFMIQNAGQAADLAHEKITRVRIITQMRTAHLWVENEWALIKKSNSTWLDY